MEIKIAKTKDSIDKIIPLEFSDVFGDYDGSVNGICSGNKVTFYFTGRRSKLDKYQITLEHAIRGTNLPCEIHYNSAGDVWVTL